MIKYNVIFILVFCVFELNAQSVEVRADYNSIGDCMFGAHNNFKTPVFLNINFADLQNTSFNEPLPYVKMLEPGYNDLFTLERDLDADVPRFNYEIKSFKSNPLADVNLDFPYLLPFAPGTKVKAFDVKNIDGFWGNETPKSWSATGFLAKPGQSVYAARQGRVVEITGANRSGEPQSWYHTFTHSITLLQTDGTLICYKNVVNKNLKLNEKVHAGELLGEVVSGAREIVLLIFHQSLHSKDLMFVIPQFQVEQNKPGIVNPVEEYTVIHPDKVRGLEMTKREKRKLLKK